MTAIQRRLLCNIIAAVFSLAVVAPLTFMAVDHRRVIDIHDERIIGPIVAGQVAHIEWDATPLRKCGGVVHRVIIVGGKKYPYDDLPVVFRGAVGVRDTYRRGIVMPVEAGPAEMLVTVERWCNPLQEWISWFRIHETRPPVRFTIGRP